MRHGAKIVRQFSEVPASLVAAVGAVCRSRASCARARVVQCQQCKDRDPFTRGHALQVERSTQGILKQQNRGSAAAAAAAAAKQRLCLAWLKPPGCMASLAACRVPAKQLACIKSSQIPSQPHIQSVWRRRLCSTARGRPPPTPGPPPPPLQPSLRSRCWPGRSRVPFCAPHRQKLCRETPGGGKNWLTV